MAPLELEGDNLGKRHQHYNQLVKEAVGKKQPATGLLSADENDIDNLLKIDIASENKNVEYILEVLKNEDMLYVSRAIKRCTWLITDKQYAHIVNPTYLHSQLIPQMTVKASNKLLLNIRLHVKEESRAEEFYNYYKEKDFNIALKWLPYCSVATIEKEVDVNYKEIDSRKNNYILKRLCEKSITIFAVLVKKCEYYKTDILRSGMFLLTTAPEKYLDLLDSVKEYEIPYIGPKYTDIIMKNCPQKIIDNFAKYAIKIDLETFVKYLKKEEIKDFLCKHVKNEDLQSWFRYDNLKHFIKYMPKEGRFDFVKKYFIDKSFKNEESGVRKLDDERSDACMMEDFGFEAGIENCGFNPASSSNIYPWYRFAPFDLAFGDLKKTIRAESSPTERNAMLAVLLTCARRNKQHIHTLLQHYNEKHINEPFKFKIQFINSLLSETDTHVFDEETWNILNNIFCSMEVYIDSDNSVQQCVQAIIAYKILHNQKVPEIIEKKFAFNSLKSLGTKLNEQDREKVFTYLYNLLVAKIQNKNTDSETEFKEAIKTLEELLSLLVDWKKEIANYPWVLEKVKEFIKIKKDKTWTVNLKCLFNKNKSWRKFMFEESLVMYPCEDACLNALKHKPELLAQNKIEVDALCRDDSVSLRRLQSKLRVYWAQSLGQEWAAAYHERLTESSGHRALIRGLCALLPPKQFQEIVQKYAPSNDKINWSEDDELLISLRKQLGKNMYLARPTPPPDALLRYARGDYLQFTLPSLNSVLYNMSSARSREHIPKFLDAPVSLQKHGIRLAFTKLESAELKHIFSKIWKTTKNSTIRAVLFQQTFDLLLKEKKTQMIEEIWELLSMFIDNLSSEENKIIYDLLGKVKKVPSAVQGQYCMKSYKFLKSLPTKANCETILKEVIYYMYYIMELLDSDFVAQILLESLDKNFTTKNFPHTQILSAYLLCSKDEASQAQKYEKVLSPLLDISLPLWTTKSDGKYIAKSNTTELLEQLNRDFTNYVIRKKMVFPTKMFADILNKLEDRLAMQNNYVLIRSWKITVALLKLLEGHKELTLTDSVSPVDPETYYDPDEDETWKQIYLKASPEFAEVCQKYLKEDLGSYFPSIYTLFAKALVNTFGDLHVSMSNYLDTLKAMLGSKESIETYLMVLDSLPDSYYLGDEALAKVKEIREIMLSHPSVEVKMHSYQKFKKLES